MRGFGLLLIIDHGDGYMSLYGQNEALYKEVGEWVDSGEVVATLGASGGQTDAGLYFEIRHNGHPVNPLSWCAGKPAAVSG
jgi:septal ring factor EnvC (AmiA/AmiB activator)